MIPKDEDEQDEEGEEGSYVVDRLQHDDELLTQSGKESNEF